MIQSPMQACPTEIRARELVALSRAVVIDRIGTVDEDEGHRGITVASAVPPNPRMVENSGFRLIKSAARHKLTLAPSQEADLSNLRGDYEAGGHQPLVRCKLPMSAPHWLRTEALNLIRPPSRWAWTASRAASPSPATKASRMRSCSASTDGEGAPVEDRVK